MIFEQGDRVKLWRTNSPGVEEYEGRTGRVEVVIPGVKTTYLVRFYRFRWDRFWWFGQTVVCFGDELVKLS